MFVNCKFSDPSVIYFNFAHGSICVFVVVVVVTVVLFCFLIRKNGKGKNADVMSSYLQVPIYTQSCATKRIPKINEKKFASWILELGGEGEVLNKYCCNLLFDFNFCTFMKEKYSGS